MSATTTIPVTVELDAAAHIAELGLQREFQEMIEHTKQAVRGLHAIEVVLDRNPEAPDDLGIVIWTHRTHPGSEDDPTGRDWGAWLVRAFPPDVWRHFVMLTIYVEENHGR
jgi:hypothetical protein